MLVTEVHDAVEPMAASAGAAPAGAAPAGAAPAGAASAGAASAGAAGLGAVPRRPRPGSSADSDKSRPIVKDCLQPGSVAQPRAARSSGAMGEVPAAEAHQALDSQAAEDQVAIIHEMCRHVENVMTAFSSQDMDQLPVEASKALSLLKGKMALFAEQSSMSGPAGGASGTDSGECSGLSDPGADSESSVVDRSVAVKNAVCKTELGTPTDHKDKCDLLSSLKLSNLTLEERFIMALEKLDTRSVPAPEPYDRSSGQSFSSFLALFEDYCRHSFRGCESLWVAELGRFLVGDMYQAFNAHRSPGDSYAQVKTKMLKWYAESKSRREAGSKAAFSRASMRDGESVRLYAARLENLFRRAFPGGKVESSKTLLDKFLKSVPRKYRKEVKSSLNQASSINDRTLGWSRVVRLVGGVEEALTSDKSSDEEPVSWTVMRSSTRPISVDRREASTQYSIAGGDTPMRASLTEQHSLSRERRDLSFQPVGLSEREKQLATVCHFCGKLGHMQRDCRRKHGLCLVCGSRDHQVVACPRRMAERRGGYSSPERLDGRNAARPREPTRRVSFGETQQSEEPSSLNWTHPAWGGSHRN